ncbi:hypothetical protein [Paracoccus sp. (in: a-proteobacteria)]|uniref:hypothetical protein n=1 Tax=Paracoccus sp. TaxID=267 RepID=UPI002AFE2457|nr:hypothetical protein [Paracoccus sp. (in: a-proteobacteria)]
MSETATSQWFHQIKGATRDLVRLCGGVRRAGEVASRSKSEVSRWQTVTDTAVIDLPSVLALEADCCVPVVTTVMAEINGRRLTDERTLNTTASIWQRYAALNQASADLSTHMAAAVADHTITPAEAEILDRSAADKEEKLRQMRHALAGVKADGPAPVTAPLRPFER